MSSTSTLCLLHLRTHRGIIEVYRLRRPVVGGSGGRRPICPLVTSPRGGCRRDEVGHELVTDVAATPVSYESLTAPRLRTSGPVSAPSRLRQPRPSPIGAQFGPPSARMNVTQHTSEATP